MEVGLLYAESREMFPRGEKKAGPEAGMSKGEERGGGDAPQAKGGNQISHCQDTDIGGKICREKNNEISRA